MRIETATSADVEQVVRLVASARTADGVSALSEAFTLRLRHGGGRHVTATDGTGLVGYAQLHDGEAELVVAPPRRHAGVGRALLDAVLAEAGDSPPRVWAHGDHPSATALLVPAGFERYRLLWQLRRMLTDPVAEPTLPAGVRIRPFVPGADEEAWLRLNARAFAEHPDQGRWTAEDLALRVAEPWFDPAGFLLAVDGDDRIVGFHWTKVHPGPPPVGEVYVLGIDPDAQGGGLGAALTAAGLRHLQRRGLRQVLLYVDEDNPRAVSLYRRQGFVQWVTDVAFRRG